MQRLSPRLRIGVLSHSQLGGSVRVATELAAELARRDHLVHLFTRAKPSFTDWRPPETLRLHCVRSNDHGLKPGWIHMEWPPWEYDDYVEQVVAVARNEGLDVLHYHYADPFAYLAQTVRRRLDGLRPAVVGTLHGSDVTASGHDPVKRGPLGAAVRAADHLTTVSAALARLAAACFDLPRLPEVIANFVELARFHPGDCCAPGEPTIAHISNFRPVKDPSMAARIFLRLRERRPARLWLIGDGPQLTDIKELLGASPYAKDVTIFGQRDDVPNLLGQVSVLLVTSVTESFCLAALEAMACGVPVVAPKVGGLPELIVDNVTGLLFPREQEEVAVEHISGLLGDQFLQRRMSEAGVRHARAYGHEGAVERYENAYRRLLTPAVC